MGSNNRDLSANKGRLSSNIEPYHKVEIYTTDSTLFQNSSLPQTPNKS